MNSDDHHLADAQARRIATRIQRENHHWLVIWAPWRQQFTAFGCFAPVPVIIDEANRDKLVKKMRASELSFTQLGPPGPARSRPRPAPTPGPPTPRAGQSSVR